MTLVVDCRAAIKMIPYIIEAVSDGLLDADEAIKILEEQIEFHVENGNLPYTR